MCLGVSSVDPKEHILKHMTCQISQTIVYLDFDIKLHLCLNM